MVVVVEVSPSAPEIASEVVVAVVLIPVVVINLNFQNSYKGPVTDSLFVFKTNYKIKICL